MTSASFARRMVLLLTVASSLGLVACGGKGGSGGGTSNVRAINLATDLPSADVYVSSTLQWASLPNDTLANNISVDAGTYTIDVKPAGSATDIFTGSYSFSKDNNYTAVVWGRQAALHVSTLGESEDTSVIASGNTRIRAFNATIDSGTVDVYVTLSGVDLLQVQKTQGLLTSGTLAGFHELAAGTYEIRVTGPDNPADLRLDMKSVVLNPSQYYTLVITQSGSGGVLLNGTVIAQGGAEVTSNNPYARVRLAAGVANGGLVSVSIGGNAVYPTPYLSPTYGPYVQVDGGNVNVTLSVNGSVISSQMQTFATGTDYTLLAYTDPVTGPALAMLTDDNRPPSTTSQAKLRLVNGLNSSDLISIQLDGRFFAQTNNIGTGAASPYASVTAAGTQNLQIMSSLRSSSNPLFTKTSAPLSTLLTAQGVYTVFMLDGQPPCVGVCTSGTGPAGFLSADR